VLVAALPGVGSSNSQWAAAMSRDRKLLCPAVAAALTAEGMVFAMHFANAVLRETTSSSQEIKGLQRYGHARVRDLFRETAGPKDITANRIGTDLAEATTEPSAR
jgi:hypothetical protein